MRTLYRNGRLLTQNPAQPEADSLLVGADGRIAAVGGVGEVQAEQVIDLQGKTLIPAFNDAHIHVWKVGELLRFRLDLRGVGSVAEMLDRLHEFATARPEQPWVLARGFNEAWFADGRMPTRHDLDRVLPDRPCQVIRTCAHIAVLNTRALEVCGITANTPVPPGGEIRLDAAGQPTGVLTETALGLVARHLPVYSADDYRQMILAAQDALRAVGIGSATDPAVHPELLAVYRQMAEAGELKIRLNAIPIRVPDGATTALPLPEHYHSDWLTVNTVKFFADGGISGKTAALHRPYRNTNERGVLRLDPVWFEQLARESQAAGFKIATHAIGDAAIEQVLDIYQRIDPQNTTGLRHRIEHLGLPTAAHLARMRELGIWCVSQPMFVGELGRNFRQYLPDDYQRRIYPYRSVLDAGVGLAFSSDAPVVRNFDPLDGIRCAVTRLDNDGADIAPTEKITFEEALRAYTRDAALANDCHTTGTLEVGKWADVFLMSNVQ